MTERIVAGRLAVAPRSARLSGPTRVPHAGAAAVATLALLALMVPPERAIPVGNLQQIVAVGAGIGVLALSLRLVTPAQRRVRFASLRLILLGKPAPLTAKAEARS